VYLAYQLQYPTSSDAAESVTIFVLAKHKQFDQVSPSSFKRC